jgi:hypothetical protein
MIGEIAALLPGCQFSVCADGLYAALAKRLPRDITFTSRMRCDAALFDQPRPRPAGTRGRKPKKGPRLPTPPEFAQEAAALGLFSLTMQTRCGQAVERLIYSRTVDLGWDHRPAGHRARPNRPREGRLFLHDRSRGVCP